MIFSLEASVEELDGLPKEESETLFSIMIDCDRAGRHFFIVNRALCDWALEKVELSRRDKNHLVSLKQSYTQRGALPNAATHYVKVKLGDQDIVPDPEGFFEIGHRRLINGEFSQHKAGFVLEDIADDVDLYHHLLCEARKQTSVPSFAFSPIHGGGGSTPRVFEHQISLSRVSVCVVDNDKLAPCDRNSGTAKKTMAILRRRHEDSTDPAKPFLGGAYTTVGRELENCIPYCILKEIPNYLAYGCRAELDSAVCEIGAVDLCDCFWMHFDIKDGIDGEKLVDKVDKGNLSEDALRWICSKLGCTFESAVNQKIEGFGDGVVRNFLNDQDALRAFHKFSRTQYWQNMFLTHLENLLWFFAAPLRDRL